VDVLRATLPGTPAVFSTAHPTTAATCASDGPVARPLAKPISSLSRQIMPQDGEPGRHQTSTQHKATGPKARALLRCNVICRWQTTQTFYAESERS